MRSLYLLVVAVFIFTGCSSKDMSMSGIGKSDVRHVFKNGIVQSTQKVLVGKNKLSTLMYAGAGGLVGGGAGYALGETKGGVIGGVIGAVTGTLIASNSEVGAFETVIRDVDSNKDVTTYLSERIENGSVVEFIQRDDNEITNVNVVETFSSMKKRLQKEAKDEQREKSRLEREKKYRTR